MLLLSWCLARMWDVYKGFSVRVPNIKDLKHYINSLKITSLKQCCYPRSWVYFRVIKSVQIRWIQSKIYLHHFTSLNSACSRAWSRTLWGSFPTSRISGATLRVAAGWPASFSYPIIGSKIQPNQGALYQGSSYLISGFTSFIWGLDQSLVLFHKRGPIIQD